MYSVQISYSYLTGCPIIGQVYQKCAPCPATCSRPFPKCSNECVPGCGCPAGKVVDTVNKKCVKVTQCSTLDCTVSSSCSYKTIILKVMLL